MTDAEPPHCLEGLAAAAARLDEPDKAARLLGVTSTIRTTTGASPEPNEQAEIDDTLSPSLAITGSRPAARA